MMRVGQGFDVHPFDQSRPLVLGGITIPGSPGLAGHSDADAVLHAITDAILGALGAGDIGTYFPSSDPKWRNAGSSIFVRHALELLQQREATILNVDITVIAQKPRLASYREQMRDSIAALLHVPSGHVNLKATTTDHLGFVGREEGICVLAVVAIEVGGSS